MKEETELTNLHKAILKILLKKRKAIKATELYTMLTTEHNIQPTWNQLDDAIADLYFYRKYTKLRQLPGKRLTIPEKHHPDVKQVLKDGKFIYETETKKPTKETLFQDLTKEEREKQKSKILAIQANFIPHPTNPTYIHLATTHLKNWKERDDLILEKIKQHPDQNLMKKEGFTYNHLHNKEINGKPNPAYIKLNQYDLSIGLSSLVSRGILTSKRSKTKRIYHLVE